MKSLAVEKDKTSLDALVELAREASGLVLTKSGLPVAQVIPITRNPKARIAPLHPGAWDVTAGFDEPLPDTYWLGKE